jgi:tetratricopeptide (TPR) repeat protein
VKPAERAPRPRGAELEATLRRDPSNADALAQAADLLLEANQSARARERAAKALESRPRHPLATYVVARIRTAAGEKDEAWKLLKEAVDVAAPEPKSLGLLADLTRERGDLAEAGRLARIGAAQFPHASGWPAALAAVHEAARDTAQLTEALVLLSAMEEHDAPPRARLARIAMARGDAAAATRWATETIHIDVANVEAHAILAETAARASRFEQAAEEYETAILLGGKRQEWLLGLARACARIHRDDRAREALRDLLETDPEYPGARELLGTLK